MGWSRWLASHTIFLIHSPPTPRPLPATLRARSILGRPGGTQILPAATVCDHALLAPAFTMVADAL